MDPIFSQQFDYGQPKPKGGMFGGGKVQIDLGRALAGYLAGIGNPAGVQALQAMNASRQQQLEHQQSLDDYNRHRSDQNADFISHRQYEIDNPLPKAPSEFDEALAATGVMPGTPEYAQAMQQRVGNMLDPVVMTPQGPMLRSQVVGSLAAPSNVTFTPIAGGPTPQASGGFLGSR